MAFSRSDFLFIYNIPTNCEENELCKDIPFLSSFKSIFCTGNIRAAFALVDTMECCTDELADERSQTVQAHFKSKNVCVDLVWFRPAGDDKTSPPSEDIIVSSFLFIYNFPPEDVSDLTLQAMTGVKNFVCLLASDGLSKCAFLELMHLSDVEFHKLKLLIPKQAIPGYYNLFFSVDEVWLQPSTTMMEVNVVKKENLIEPELKKKLDGMNDEEISQLLQTLSDKEALLKKHLKNDDPKFIELAAKIKSIALYFADRTSVSLSTAKQNKEESIKVPEQSTVEIKPPAPVVPQTAPPPTVSTHQIASKFKQSPFIFVPNLSSTIDMKEMCKQIPQIDKFLILERPDETHIAGFVFLRNNNSQTCIQVANALKDWQLKVTHGEDPLNLDRICLETNSIRNFRSKYTSLSVNQEKGSREISDSNTKGGSSRDHKTVTPDEQLNPVALNPEEKFFLQSSGNSVPGIPLFRCVHVVNLPANMNETQIIKQFSSNLVFTFLKTNTESRRLLCFGGSESDAKSLCRKLSDRISVSKNASVHICNLLEYLAPIPPHLAEEAKCRRLLLTNLPNWPPNLLRQRVAFFAPKSTSCWFPLSKDRTSLGYGYVGYGSFVNCKEDFKRLSDWRISNDCVVRVFYAVDSGWSTDRPLSDPCKTNPTYRTINSEEIARIRGAAARKEEDNASQFGDALLSHRPEHPLASDLHETLARHSYNAVGETLQALVIKPLYKDVTASAVNVFLESKIRLVQSFDIQLLEKGSEKVLTLFFGTKASKEYEIASSKLRLLYQSKDSQLENLIISSQRLIVERQLTNEFTPVSAEFALARGCQFLEVFELPIGEGWTKGTYQEIVKTLFPEARSFYIPIANVSGIETVRGCAFVRFDDPRKCREAYQAMAPRCRYGNNREARVCYAALHMTINVNYRNQKFACPLHNCFPWMCYDTNKQPFPWTADTGAQKPFFCTCHLGCLPFKE